MIPLTEFSSVDKIRNLESRGYVAGYTAESWRAEFPEIDPKYILCPPSILLPASLFYYDPKHYICFNAYIYGEKMLFPSYSSDGKDGHDRLTRMISHKKTTDSGSDS